MMDAGRHPRIKLLAFSEVDDVQGYVGNFKVTVRKKARYVDADKCTGCGECANVCPVELPNEWDEGTRLRKAIYRPFPQAVPRIPVIDPDNCIWFQRKKCRACEKLCPTDAIKFDQEDELFDINVGNRRDVGEGGTDGVGRLIVGSRHVERTAISLGQRSSPAGDDNGFPHSEAPRCDFCSG